MKPKFYVWNKNCRIIKAVIVTSEIKANCKSKRKETEVIYNSVENASKTQMGALNTQFKKCFIWIDPQ